MAKVNAAVPLAALAAAIGMAGLNACSTRNQSVVTPPPVFQPEPEPPPVPVSNIPARIVGQALAAKEEVSAVVVLQSRTPFKYPDLADRP